MGEPTEIKKITVTNQLDTAAEFRLTTAPSSFKLEPGETQEVTLILRCSEPNATYVNNKRLEK